MNELVKSGQISAEEAEHHPRRNVLTRALGTDEQVEVDVQTHVVGSRTICCCCAATGLTNMVNRSEIVETLEQDELDLDSKADSS